MEKIEPGVYFGMPEDVYHAAPACSSSGIKEILASPLTWWGRHLDPDREEEETRPGKAAGTALHKRLLEPDAFAAAYAVAPVLDDHPDAIDGGADLRARCADLGLARSGTLIEMCQRIADADPDAVLWPVIRAKFNAENEGREILKPSHAATIERAARFIADHRDARRALTGGWHEVSIFWTDGETGAPMKSRLDSLKPRCVVDLKTFSNSQRLPVDQAIARAVASYHYHVQGAVYLDAAEAAKGLVKQGRITAVTGELPDPTGLDDFAASPAHSFVFVFLEQALAPNIRVRQFLPGNHGNHGGENLLWQAGHAGFRHGVDLYADYMERFGPDRPWVEHIPMKPFQDEEFPAWTFD